MKNGIYLSQKLTDEIFKRFKEQEGIVVRAYEDVLNGRSSLENMPLSDHPFFIYLQNVI